jgi:hypothetical protein
LPDSFIAEQCALATATRLGCLKADAERAKFGSRASRNVLRHQKAADGQDDPARAADLCGKSLIERHAPSIHADGG